MLTYQEIKEKKCTINLCDLGGDVLYGEITLVHEDIYVYIDPIVLSKQNGQGKEVTFTNDNRYGANSLGRLRIKANGRIDSITLNIGGREFIIKKSLSNGQIMTLDFDNNHFKRGDEIFFLNEKLLAKENSFFTISSLVSGQGDGVFEYEYRKPQRNDCDLLFCESIDVDHGPEVSTKTNIHGINSYRDLGTRGYTWGISGIWNQEEIKKFSSPTGMFRLRLVDEDGRNLEVLMNCTINNKSKSSGEGGDYAYTIGGVCEDIK
jgi:hypothetical protein